MKIGLDFDNTIVCYDTAFAEVTEEWKCVAADTPRTKLGIRNYLRSVGNEDTWTRMQGHVYGPGMVHARPYPGVAESVRALRAQGHAVFVISHRTKKPFLGPPHDLHAFARDWLTKTIRHQDAPLFGPQDAFFAETLPQKIARIGTQGCDVFLDDLVDVLEHANFPSPTRGILFDPNREHATPESARFKVIHTWDQLAQFLPLSDVAPAAMRLLAGVGCDGARSAWQPLAGGANNTVLMVRDGARAVVLKHYRRDPSDSRDRLGAEVAFLRYAHSVAPGYTPELFALDEDAGLAVLSYVAEPPATADDVTAAHVARAGTFLAALNAPAYRPATTTFGIASEAAFSASDHVALIEDRLQALDRDAEPTPATAAQSRAILDALHRDWDGTRDVITRAVAGGQIADALPSEDRILSPSDFGFHNARFDQDGTLRFFDFEYAGWDDPAKTLSDFFLQPRIPVDFSWRAVFLAAGPPLRGEVLDRAEILMPLFAVKWACIVLKSLIPAQRARRLQIYPGASIDEMLSAQIDLASAILAKLRRDHT